MRFERAKDFTGGKAWDALDLAEIEGATVRLHWTDRPYRWHANDGREVFVVLDGEVEMRWREQGEEKSHLLRAGELCAVEVGDEHIASPRGP
ncbi:MAG: hypothetical protein ACREDZ_00295, partial [Kiloniellales bacterium]